MEAGAIDSTIMKKSILVFDDDAGFIDTVRTILRDYGYAVNVVNEGDSAIMQLETSNPDLIIANISFPGISGHEVLEWVAGKNLYIPVIITGDSSEKNILDSFRNGATDFIKKPVDPDFLKTRISAILSKKGGEFRDNDYDADELASTMEHDKRDLSNLLRISSSVNVIGDTKIILNNLTELAAESMNCEAASILLVNERNNTLEFVVATGEKKQRLHTIAIPMGEGIAGWVAVHDEPQIVNDTSSDPRFTGKVDEESGFLTRQILAIPLKLETRVIGVLEVINSMENRELGQVDLTMLQEIGRHAAAVIETSKSIESHQNFYVQITNILVKAIEKKDLFNEGHPWKVAELCHKIAQVIEMSDIEKNDLHFGALLHDIGKLDMPSVLFNKRALSEREMEFIRQHPVKGA